MRALLHAIGLGLLLVSGLLSLAHPAALVPAAVGLGLALATHQHGVHGPEVD